jgi:hypothetical protein
MQVSSQLGQLFEVASAELSEPAAAEWRQSEPHDPVVVVVGSALDEAGGFGPVDQTDCAVVPNQERLGNVSDGRLARTRTSSNCEQKLMLHGGETRRGGLFLAPLQEASKPGPELE